VSDKQDIMCGATGGSIAEGHDVRASQPRLLDLAAIRRRCGRFRHIASPAIPADTEIPKIYP
jgi:hypothetical protein